MLLREMMNSAPGTYTLQLVLACAVGLRGSSSTCEAVLYAPSKDLDTYVVEQQEKYPNTNDDLHYVLKYFMEEDVLGISAGSGRLKKMNLNQALVLEGISTISFQECYMECLTILQKNQISLLPWLFTFTTYCRNAIETNVINSLKMRYGVSACKRSVIDAIISDFTIFFKKYSAENYSYTGSEADNLVGYIVNAFRYFEQQCGAMSVYAKETDQDGLVAGGDGETTALDLRPAKQKKKKSNIEFRALTTKIAEASSVLYAHGSPVKTIYDIFTQYNVIRVNKILAKTKAALSSKTQFYSVVCTWGEIDNYQGYANAVQKKCNRDHITDVMQVLVKHPISIQEVNKLYNQARYADDNKAFNKVGAAYSAKNGISIFSTPLRVTKSSAKNSDIFYKIFVGYTALREFMEYLEINEIDPLTIPPDIFRNPDLPRRFSSLKDYMEHLPIVNELRAEALSRKLPKLPIETNDEVYEMVIAGKVDVPDSRTNYILNETSLLDIKYAVEHVRSYDQQSGMLSSMTHQLFRSTLPYIQEVSAVVLENKNLIDGKSDFNLQLLTSNAEKQAVSNLQKLNEVLEKKLSEQLSKGVDKELLQDANVNIGNGKTVKLTNRVYLVSLHYSLNNIVTWLTDDPINTSTPQYRSFVAENYGALSGTENLIRTGGINEWSPTYTMVLCYALATFVSSTNFTGLKDKFLQEKIALMFVATLEKAMSLEGHPVIQDVYYNLKEDTLEQEFAYVDEKYRSFRIQAIRNCYEVLCYNNAQNDFELLSFLFMVAKRISTYYFTNRRILGKVRLQYSGAITEERLQSLNKTNEANRKYVDDGDNGVIIRASVYLDYLEQARIVSDVDYMPKLNMKDNYLQPLNASHDTPDYLKRMKLQLINVHNKYVMDHQDVYQCFDKLKDNVHRLYDKSCQQSSFAVSPDLRRTLSKASVEIGKMTPTDPKHAMVASIMRVNSITDEDGYLLDYGVLYKSNSGAYLHKEGYFVDVLDTAESKYEITAICSLSSVEGVLNKVYG